MVKHVLKDGRRVKTIEGHLIKRKDFPAIYAIVDELSKQKEKKIMA